MSRIYNPENAGKERNQLSRGIVLALRELMKQQGTDNLTKDLAAYIAFSLEEISSTIEVSVGAWEKRGYWVKADKFRLEWEWAGQYGKAMADALKKDDWATVALTSAKIAQKLNKVTVPERNHIGTPWVGSWTKMSS